MDNSWQIKIQYEMQMLGFGLYMFRNIDYNTKEFICSDGTIKTIKANKASSEPLWALRLESTEQLRQIIEEAERQGVQAPTTERIFGELQATKAHLNDLRLLIPKLATKPNWEDK